MWHVTYLHYQNLPSHIYKQHTLFSHMVHPIAGLSLPQIPMSLSTPEDILSQILIPTLTRRPTPGDLERDLIALLVCQDGLGIKVPPLAFFTTYHGTRLHTPQRSIQTLAWLCYGWQPANLPTNCICGALFSVEHVLLHCMCQKGLPTLRHNEVRDMTAQMLTEVSSEVCLL